MPAVPTRTAAHPSRSSRPPSRAFGTSVVKPRVGAGGGGVIVVDDPADPRLGTVIQSHPELPPSAGPWVVQPLVESVRTEGETSVFVLDGAPVSQVDKLPAGDEIRVHEHFGGASRPVAVRDEYVELALSAMAAVAARRPAASTTGGSTCCGSATGRLAVSELELIEPGLYLDVLPGNAEPFADLVEQPDPLVLAGDRLVALAGSSAKHDAGTLDTRVTTRSDELRSRSAGRNGPPGQPGRPSRAAPRLRTRQL